MITAIQSNFIKLEYKDYGSLDFPCDFCNKNSYAKKFIISSTNNVEFAICEECLEKSKRSKE